MPKIRLNTKHIACVLLALTLFAQTVINSNILGIIIIVLSLSLVNDMSLLFPGLFISSILNENCFVISTITASRYLTILIIIISIIRYFHRTNKRDVFYLLCYLTVFAFYIVISSLITNGFNANVITMILNILLVYAFAIQAPDDSKEEFVIRTTYFVCFVLIIYYLLIYLLGGAVFNTYGSVDFISGTNKNYIGMGLAQAGAFIFSFLIVTKTSKIQEAINLVVMVIVALLLVLTGAKSALIGLLACITVGIIFLVFKRDFKLSRAIALVVVICFGAYIADTIIQSIPSLAYRYSVNTIVQSGGTGRLSIWEIVWKDAFLKHPIFGVGFGEQNIVEILAAYGDRHSGTHNLYLDILGTTGLFGFIYLFSGLIYKIRESIKLDISYGYSITPLLLIVCFLGNGIGENIWTERFAWVAVAMLVWMVSKQKYRRDRTLMRSEK